MKKETVPFMVLLVAACDWKLERSPEAATHLARETAHASSCRWRRITIAALLPQSARDDERIDVALLPPLALPACGVNLVVVGGAKRHGEFIADLEA